MGGAKELAAAVTGKLRDAGYVSYLVGGCVRDLLLGEEPEDYDIATAAPPGEVLRLFPEALLVGAQFGVMLVRKQGAQVEVATFRSDHAYADGRHPAGVTFEQDPARDVQRRDFTVNALLLDPVTGLITDFVNGQEDLRSRSIRAIGEAGERFREDYLRLLRAVRFASRLDFTIEPATFHAVREHAALIRGVAAERVRDEVSAMLTGPAPRRAFELLEATGLLHEILPEVEALRNVEQPPEFHPEGDVWTHTMMMLEGLKHPTLTLALGVLLHDIGKPATWERAADRIRFNGHVEEGERTAARILGRLRYSNAQTDQVLALIRNHMRFKDVKNMRESTVKRFLRMPDFDEHLALHRLDCLSSHGSLSNFEWMQRRRGETPPEVLQPEPLVTGKDLIQAGLEPGPRFKEALRAVEEAQLNGEIASREAAMELVQRVWKASSER